MFKIFDQAKVKTLISTRVDGSMKFGENDKDRIVQNRENFLRKNGIETDKLVSADLSHGTNVALVSTSDAGKFILEIDGLITAEKDIFLSVTVADCLPIFLSDINSRFVGILHCGWRGLSRGIIKNGIGRASREFNIKSSEIIAGIGPGIGVCHYEVKEDVMGIFRSQLPPEVMSLITQKNRLDLKQIARYQLMESGVLFQNIKIDPDCTYCREDIYFSYRRDKPESIEAMMAVIRIIEI